MSLKIREETSVSRCIRFSKRKYQQLYHITDMMVPEKLSVQQTLNSTDVVTSKLSPRSGLLESKRHDPIVVVVPYRGLTLRHRLRGNNILAARDMESWAATSVHGKTG
jgi:hypothetical protein